MTPIGPPPVTDLEVDVSDEQIAFFRENGYLALERITSDDERVLDVTAVVFDGLYEQRRRILLGGSR